MHSEEEAEYRIQRELKMTHTAAWIAKHQDIEPEMDPEDPIDNEPILLQPRREFSTVFRTRNYASAFEDVTPMHYRTVGQWWSCSHALDDPFESEDEETSNAENKIIFLTNIPRCCRKCFFFGTDFKHCRMEAGVKTTLVRKAKTAESVPNFDKGILACSRNKLFQDPISQSEVIRDHTQQLTSSPETDSSSPASKSKKKIHYSASSRGYQNQNQNRAQSNEPNLVGQGGLVYVATPMPVFKKRKYCLAMTSSERLESNENMPSGAPAASGTPNGINEDGRRQDLKIPSRANAQVSQDVVELGEDTDPEYFQEGQ